MGDSFQVRFEYPNTLECKVQILTPGTQFFIKGIMKKRKPYTMSELRIDADRQSADWLKRIEVLTLKNQRWFRRGN